MINDIFIKTLKYTIDNIIGLSETSTKNTYFLCGIAKSIIDCFRNTEIIEFNLIKETKNGIILEYKDNRVVLQKDNREHIIDENSIHYYNFYNKPLEEFNIIDISELNENDPISN